MVNVILRLLVVVTWTAISTQLHRVFSQSFEFRQYKGSLDSKSVWFKSQNSHAISQCYIFFLVLDNRFRGARKIKKKKNIRALTKTFFSNVET